MPPVAPPSSPAPSAFTDAFIACPDCDLLVAKIQPPKRHKSQCPRCGCTLLYHCHDTISRSLAIALAGLLLFFPATLLPLLTFERLGFSERGNILQTIGEFVHGGYYFVAAATLLSTVVFPLMKLSLLALVSFFLRIKRYPGFLGPAFRLHNHLDEWAMVEVYLLGIMVTLIKMHGSTTIHFNAGIICFTGLVLLTMASSLTVCRESFWMLIESRGKRALQKLPAPSAAAPKEPATASTSGLVLCRECGKVQEARASFQADKQRCARCGARLHIRKPASLARTWALIATATILLFPAYLLPVMRIDFLGVPQHSTIIDGIKVFFQDGSYFVAIIILTASVFIPVFKIVGLAIGLLTINLNRPRFLRQKTAMYRFIDFIGKWSMLDIFVIALLGFFINFGILTSITTAPGATYFCMVVITTMLAALAFDPRLMWDQLDTSNTQAELMEQQAEE